MGDVSITLANVHQVKEGFEVLQTTKQSQTAVMILTPGADSSEKMNVHKKSDQVLLLLEGELQAEVGLKKSVLRAGDSCIVPAGTPHRFENKGKARALTFNVYSPPEYSPGEKD
jgi:mannose-6-phosphate isomerase-like protein (cupin superfamily)